VTVLGCGLLVQTARVPRHMVVIQTDGTSPVLSESTVLEVSLQEQLKAHPELLPVEEFDLVGPLMVVGRETTLASGAADLVAVTRAGDLVLVEFKTGPQNPDFRHALAQLLDYGADLWGMTLNRFDEAVAVRYFTSSHCPTTSPTRNATGLLAAAQATWPGIESSELEQFTDRLANALERGAFHYVVAAQRFVPAMEATVAYLNASMKDSSFYLVELVHFGGDGLSAFEARTVAKPSKQSTSKASSVTTSEIDFLASIADDNYRSALRDLLDFCRELDLRFAWGAIGTSIRLKTPFKDEPISIAWLFPGGGIGWMGLSHLTLGHDAAVPSSVPQLAGPLEQYLTAVSDISGATQTKSPTVAGYTFEPGAIITEHALIEDALSDLVTNIATL